MLLTMSFALVLFWYFFKVCSFLRILSHLRMNACGPKYRMAGRATVQAMTTNRKDLRKIV